MQVTELKILHLSHVCRKADGKSYSIENNCGADFLWWTLTIPSQGAEGPSVVCAVQSDMISPQLYLECLNRFFSMGIICDLGTHSPS